MIEKERKLADALNQLKTEFIGIDEQIEGVIDNMRTWYLFPELQERPLVVCLWGLTGVGKTALVKRIATLLDIEKDLVYFNFAEIGECSTWEIESNIEEQLSNERSNRMFVYDEFQYAATIDSKGEELDNKHGLKPFWELLDSGKIHKRNSFWKVRSIYDIAYHLVKINSYCPMQIVEGKWVNAAECLKGCSPYELREYRKYFRFNVGGEEEKKPNAEGPIFGKGDFFIYDEYVERIIELIDQTKSQVSDKILFYNKICKMDIAELLNLINEAYDGGSKGYDMKFNDSIIFVLGNLDEAYMMALDVDPDMSPDQFHKMTKKITIFNIKEALQKRFRNEQIARLGNIHMIYPSFSCDSFKKIISMALNNYAAEVAKHIGVKLEFDRRIHKAIYDESVYPTHGTRPIFSTVHEMIKTKLPLIIRDLEDKRKNVATIKYTFKKKQIILKCLNDNGDVLLEKAYKANLRLEPLRDCTKDEEQALTALHESGHFVLYSKLTGRLPEKLCSKTVSDKTGGFLMMDIDKKNIGSKKELEDEIKVLIAGYAAEKLICSEDRKATHGASSDLWRATTIASKMVRKWGMGNDIAVTTYLSDPVSTEAGSIVKDDMQDDANGQIRDIIQYCYNEVVKVLNEKHWRKMLKESALWLTEHATMSKKKMKEIYDIVPEEVKNENKENENYYREKINNL